MFDNSVSGGNIETVAAKSAAGFARPKTKGGRAASPLWIERFFCASKLHGTALLLGDHVGSPCGSPVPLVRSCNPHGRPFLFASWKGRILFSFTKGVQL